MIVDDDSSIREVVKDILLSKGQKVVGAINGNDCIKQISKTQKDVDIILLDIRMPGLKPKQIIKKVKRILPKAYIIYLTSVKAFQPTEEDLKMGWEPEIVPPVIGYIEKPVIGSELIEGIEHAIYNNNKFLNLEKKK